MSVWQVHGPDGPVGEPEATIEAAKARAVRHGLKDQHRVLDPDLVQALWTSLKRRGWRIEMDLRP